jgi:hypothetical protein
MVCKRGKNGPGPQVGPDITLPDENAAVPDEGAGKLHLRPQLCGLSFRRNIALRPDVFGLLPALRIVELAVEKASPLHHPRPDRTSSANEQKRLLHGLSLELCKGRLKYQRMPGIEALHSHQRLLSANQY